MRKALLFSLIFISFLYSSCTFLEEKAMESEQTKITAIHPTEKYIGIKIGCKDLKINVPEGTKITKGEKEIEYSGLSVGDNINISYVKRDWLFILGKACSAKAIKVLE